MPEITSRPRRALGGVVSPLLMGVAVVFAAVVPYLTVLHGEFVAGDIDFIVENIALRGDDLVRSAFTHGYWYAGGPEDASAYYRPLVVILDGLELRRFGGDPFGYHLTNVLLHALTSLAVWALGKSLLGTSGVAWLGALLFAAHPVQVHAVAYISGRTSVMSTFFVVWSAVGVLSAARAIRDGESAWKFGIAASLGASLALLCKESAAVLPALACALVVWVLPSPPRELRRYAGLVAALVALVLAYLAVRHAVLGQVGATRQPLWYRLGPLASLLSLAKIVAYYPLKLLWPTQLSYLPPFVPALDAYDLKAWLSLLLLSLACVFVVYPSRHRTARLLLGWTLLCLAPVSGIVPLEYFVKEHHAYMAAAGFLPLCAHAAAALFELGRARLGQNPIYLQASLASCVVLLLAALTHRHAQTFQSSEALLRRIVALEPEIDEGAFAHRAMNKSAQRFAVAHLDLGLLELKAQRQKEGLAHFERADRLARSDDLRYQVRYLAGICLMGLGDAARAKTLFTGLLAQDARKPWPALKLAEIARREGNAGDERRSLQEACRRGAQAACQRL